MSSNKLCAKCDKKIQNRRFLKCQACNRNLDLECANMSEKLYYLMEPARKKSWICEKCNKQSKRSKNRPKTSTPNIKTNAPKVLSSLVSENKFDHKPESITTSQNKIENSEYSIPSTNCQASKQLSSETQSASPEPVKLNTGHRPPASLPSGSQEPTTQVEISTSTGSCVPSLLTSVSVQQKILSPQMKQPSSTPTVLCLEGQPMLSPPPQERSPVMSSKSSPQNINPASEGFSYVAHRRRNNFQETSLPNIEGSDLSLSESEPGSMAAKSLPDLSTLQNQEMEIMKNEILDLKLKLQATEDEMDNLLLENKSMAIKLKEQDRKIKDLLTICSTTANNKNKSKNNRNKNKPGDQKQKLHQSLQIHNTPKEKSINTSSKPSAETPLVPNIEHRDSITTSAKKARIIIIADQQGRGLQQALQQLLDARYRVTCFWKDGACLQEVLNTCKTELCGFELHDFVVVVGGMNDENPLNLKTTLLNWLNVTCHTNIIICGLPCNAYLGNSLNRDIELICTGFTHCKFVESNYGKSYFGSKYFSSNLSFAIFREIIHRSHQKFKQLISNSQFNKDIDYVELSPALKLTSTDSRPETPNIRLHKTLPFL